MDNGPMLIPLTEVSGRGPLDEVPIACTLDRAAGRAQLRLWRRFDADYALSSDEGTDVLTVHYVDNDDSRQRLHDLVAVEGACCSFVRWTIDESHQDLRLIVTGSADAIAALSIPRAPSVPKALVVR